MRASDPEPIMVDEAVFVLIPAPTLLGFTFIDGKALFGPDWEQKRVWYEPIEDEE